MLVKTFNRQISCRIKGKAHGVTTARKAESSKARSLASFIVCLSILVVWGDVVSTHDKSIHYANNRERLGETCPR